MPLDRSPRIRRTLRPGTPLLRKVQHLSMLTVLAALVQLASQMESQTETFIMTVLIVDDRSAILLIG